MSGRLISFCPRQIGICIAALLAAVTVGPLGAVELPQRYAWQQTLRRYLASLDSADFAIADPTWELADHDAWIDHERLYRDWIALKGLSRLPQNVQFYAAPEWFTLRRIERPDGVYTFQNPAGMTWWTKLDVPGNPFYKNAAARRRALVVAAVDMIMLESCWADPRNLNPSFTAANLGSWAYTYLHAKGLLPKDAQKAFEEGLLFYLEHVERLAPCDGNTNMDMREISTLATLSKVFPEEPMRSRLVRDARRILFGDPHRGPDTTDPRRGTFHAAGYIGEADGPETSYNGISLFHLLEAAMTTRGDPAWDAFMPEVVDRMLRFKAYNTFPEPDGRWDGPSSWSTRTNDPYARDQRNRSWRPMASAMLSDEGLYLLGVDPASYDGAASGIASPEQMLSDVRQSVQRLGKIPIKGEGRTSGLEPPLWQEDHWLADMPYTWDDYVDGSYARFSRVVAAKSPLLLPPPARDDDFSINFDDEFWVAKHGDWAFQVEAVPDMSRAYDVGSSGALAGGSLAAFWTKHCGLVILGRLPDKWNYVTWRPKEHVKEENRWSVDRWTTHHLWGRSAEGKAFSTARQRHPWVSFELEGDVPTVHVAGFLGEKGTVEEEGAIKDDGHVVYRRKFEKLPDGLRITSELLSRGEDALEHRGQQEDRRDRLVELWESLPVYIDYVRRSDRQKEPKTVAIEFRVGGRWQKASVELTPGVEAIRVTRFAHPVVVRFDAPQQVDLADEVVHTSYQSRDLIQNVRIDLLGSGGRPAVMPKHARVCYTIQPGT